MDEVDRKISEIVQTDSRPSNAEIAAAVGVSVSTANERLRKLTASGHIAAWRAVLEPHGYGAGLCGFLLVDVDYEGEEAAIQALAGFKEVQEIHHVSGPHSYLLKIRIANMPAMQRFLQDRLKPLRGINRTETIFVLHTVKETTEIAIAAPA